MGKGIKNENYCPFDLRKNSFNWRELFDLKIFFLKYSDQDSSSLLNDEVKQVNHSSLVFTTKGIRNVSIWEWTLPLIISGSPVQLRTYDSVLATLFVSRLILFYFLFRMVN